MATTNTDVPVGLTDGQQAYIDGLREFASFLEAHPDAVPGGGYGGEYFCCSGGDNAESLTAKARSLGGRWEKQADDPFFRLVRTFGPHQFGLYTRRENVCERVVTTEEVTRKVPDPDALAKVPTVTVTETVETVTWECPPSLLAETRS